jgi:hypothetical protein
MLCLVPKLFSTDVFYIGGKDTLYREIIDRGYTICGSEDSCEIIVVNSDKPVESRWSQRVAIEKMIYVTYAPPSNCTYGQDPLKIKFAKGKLTIAEYGIYEELDELLVTVFSRQIMKSIGQYSENTGDNKVNVAFRQKHFPVEYYAFDITQSKQLMDVLFPRIHQQTGLQATAISDSFANAELQKTDTINKKDSSLKQKILLAMLFGLLLNIPLCIIIFASGALEDSNRNIVYNFMIGRAIGLLVIGILFITIVGYFQSYNHLLTLAFGVMCIGISFSIYKKKQFCKNAFSYTGGFIKGVTPCAKLTPVFPLLIGVSLSEGLIIMLTFIMSSTLYFLLLFYFGVRLLKRFSGRINKKYTSVIFLLIGLYFIARGLHLI